MQCSLVPRIAKLRFTPVIAAQPDAGLAFVARHRGVAEIHAARALQQIAGCRRHVPKLRRRATQDRFGKNRVVFANERMMTRDPNCERSRQSLGRRRADCFDLVQRQID